MHMDICRTESLM